jgi:hypothetical protein
MTTGRINQVTPKRRVRDCGLQVAEHAFTEKHSFAAFSPELALGR